MAQKRAAPWLHVSRHGGSPLQFDTWLVYLVASIGLSLSPGPNGLLALTHGALHGRRKTLFTIFGGAVGFVMIIALSMFGIGALIKSSVVWLAVLKWLGGASLVWLGIQVWRSPPIAVDLGESRPLATGWSLFRQVCCFSLPFCRTSSIRAAVLCCSSPCWQAPSWQPRGSPSTCLPARQAESAPGSAASGAGSTEPAVACLRQLAWHFPSVAERRDA